MIYNGQEVKTWVHNGVEVFVSAKPFYWIKDRVVQDGFLADYATYTVSYKNYGFSSKLTNLTILGDSNGNCTFTGESESVNTQGNKYMEVIINDYGIFGILDSFKVAGVECKDKLSNGGTITVDVSNMETVTISVILTSWASGNQSWINIKSIRFYS